MILEGIVTTLGLNGECNIAPMGPRVEPDLRRFLLRPFRSSTTYRNLKATGEGVFHITDDVVMIARGAIGPIDIDTVPNRAADVVRGRVLLGACRYHEFQVRRLDDRDERATIEVETVAQGALREFLGFNRAKHAVVEAAILATRTHLIPLEEIVNEFRKLAILVEKTGGPAEHEAFDILREFIDTQPLARSVPCGE